MQSFWPKVTLELKTHRYFYLVMLLLALAMMLTLTTSMRGADGREYLRWVHSLTFDQDLHLYNDLEATGGSYKLTPTGFVFERVNIGAPLLWLPFYGAAALFLPPADNKPYPADNNLQMVWLNFSSWLYPILGGILVFAALRRVFAPGAIAVALAATLLGTPVLFYMMIYPMSVHPSLLFLSALLLFLWFPAQPTTSPRTPLHYAAIGVVIGWTMLGASYSIAFFLLPGIDLLRELMATRRWRQPILNGLAVAGGGLIGFAPQMLVWWFLFGGPFSSPYAGQMFWSDPYFLEVLFSTYHGLFFYAPILLLVLPGLWWWSQINRWAAAGLALTGLALAYIISAHSGWWSGTSFGNRYFMVIYPFFVLGLTAFIQKLKKWALLPVGLGGLWTVGLYLQHLNGVGFTSESVVYSAAQLSQGQLPAFANTFNLLPLLLLNRPWLLVPAITLPLLLVLLLLISRLTYQWAGGATSRPVGRNTGLGVVAVGLAVVLFVGVAGWRGQQARAALAATGFFERSTVPVVTHEVKEVSGKAGLATRAIYHQQIGQPEQAIADLQLAAQLWKEDDAPAATRQFLGTATQLAAVQFWPAPNLAFPGQARLIGYKILQAGPNAIHGELYWEKLDGEKSRIDFTPVVRAFDANGNFLATTTVSLPFPAYYLPPGHFFKDDFTLAPNAAAGQQVWLEVAVSELFNLPVTAAGQPTSGIFAPVTLPAEAATPVAAPNSATPPTWAVTTYPRRFEPTRPLNLLNTPVTPAITLAGYNLSINTEAGQFLAHVTLHWTATANVPGDYLVSLRLLAATGQPVINYSGVPVNQTRPTSTWRQGEWLIDTHTLPIPALPPGNYQLALALIDAATGQPAQSGPITLQNIQIP